MDMSKPHEQVLYGSGIAIDALLSTIGVTVAFTAVLLSYVAGGAKYLAILASNKVNDKEEDPLRYLTGNPVILSRSVASIVWPRLNSKESISKAFDKSSVDDLEPMVVPSAAESEQSSSEEPQDTDDGASAQSVEESKESATAKA
jgi:hypothetical protein